MPADPDLLMVNHNQIAYAALAREHLAAAQDAIDHILLGEGEHLRLKATLDRMRGELYALQWRSEQGALEYWMMLVTEKHAGR